MRRKALEDGAMGGVVNHLGLALEVFETCRRPKFILHRLHERLHGAVPQLVQALANGDRLLQSRGASRADVVKTTVFVTDMEGYGAVNQAYAEFFGDHRPARSVVAVAGLPMGAAVEVELWAYRPTEQ